MKRIMIMGATSGIGYETARIFLEKGYVVGVVGRRIENLYHLEEKYRGRCFVGAIDVTSDDAVSRFKKLASDMGGMDIYLHVSGTGAQNQTLEPSVELTTVQTNCTGFTRMITAAYAYFVSKGGGHIAAVTSIAGTRGLGAAPAYSATKRYQNIYIDALSQLSSMQGKHIRFTDIRPGFVDTPLLKNGAYPMLLDARKVAARIYGAVNAGRRRVVIDWKYALIVAIWRMIPEFIWEKMPVGKKPVAKK